MFIRLNVARTVSTSLSVVKLVKMVLSDYSKLRILSLHWRGYKVSTIVDHLVLEDGIRASMQGVRQFLKRYGNHGTITRKPGSGLPGKLTPSAKMMTRLLHSCNSTYGLYVSLTTILRNRHQLGWVYHGSAYCQLIRQANKQKQLDWARTYLHDSFDDVIWSNETTVQLESHRRFSYRKEGEKPCPKPRAKHPVKVHVWAGITKKGPSAVCVFEGMNAPLYCEILERTLLPFIQEKFPPLSTH